jgi:hypothetical protein
MNVNRILALLLLSASCLWAQSQPATTDQPKDMPKDAGCQREKGSMDGKMDCCKHMHGDKDAKAGSAKNEMPDCCKGGKCDRDHHEKSEKKG